MTKPDAPVTKGNWLLSDLLASIVLFLVAIPLSLGMAIAAGVPEHLQAGVGILAAVVGGIVVGLLGGSPLAVSGPEAGLAVMIGQFIEQFGWDKLCLIILTAGVLQLIAGILRLGQWFRAVPPAVIKALLAGMGLLIFASQFHIMVDEPPPGRGKDYGALINLISIPEAVYMGLSSEQHRIPAIVGVSTILTILFWANFSPRRLSFLPPALIGVVVGTILAAILQANISYVRVPENLLDTVGNFLPVVSRLAQEPNWSWSRDGLSIFLGGVALAFVASAATLLTCSAADTMQQHAPRTNYDRELMAQGIGNTLCGALQLLPISAAVVRTAANIQSGAQTRWSTVLHGVWLLVLCTFAPKLLSLIPIASLAAILVYAGARLFQWRNFITFWNLGKDEFAIYVITLSSIVIFDVLTGIVVGVALAILKLVVIFSHLSIDMDIDHEQRRVNMRLSGAATFIRIPKLADALGQVPGDYELHVHLDGLTYIDHACIELLANWEKQYEKTGGSLVLDWESLTAKFRQVGQTASNNTKNNQNSSGEPTRVRRNS